MAQTKATQLKALAQAIIDQKTCESLAQSATQLVMGDGSPDAELMFIGEAPGKDEDIQGLPFVGRAGQFLNEMLNSIKLKRPDVYITNIVKYRPPNNRDPEPEEITAFMPFLIKQLKIIQPKLVATLGRFSTNVFLPQARISVDHGQPKRINLKLATPERLSLVVLPLYHPAAALYNGGMRQTLLDDFAKIPSILELIKTTNKTNSPHKLSKKVLRGKQKETT